MFLIPTLNLLVQWLWGEGSNRYVPILSDQCISENSDLVNPGVFAAGDLRDGGLVFLLLELTAHGCRWWISATVVVIVEKTEGKKWELRATNVQRQEIRRAFSCEFSPGDRAMIKTNPRSLSFHGPTTDWAAGLIWSNIRPAGKYYFRLYI